MEEKLKKICRIVDLKLNERYSISRNISMDFSFIVKEISRGSIQVYYGDGMAGIFFIDDDLEIFEYPLSSLERELL
jgi:hypothetical protein